MLSFSQERGASRRNSDAVLPSNDAAGWLASAMLVGWLGIVLFPGFVQASTQAVGSAWRSLGLGIAVLAGVPVVIVVIAITLVGLPLALMLFATYLIAMYLTKIWVGAFLGQILLRPSGTTKHDWLLGLFFGLLILTIVGLIPFLGGLVHFAVVCLGLGAFTWRIYQASRTARQPQGRARDDRGSLGKVESPSKIPADEADQC